MLRSFNRIILLTFFVFFEFCYNANAFFTEDYKKQMLYGAFKKKNNAVMYIGIRAGFLVKTWAPNLITMISPNSNAVERYLSQIPNKLYNKTSGNYSYSVGVDFGFHMDGSNFRHELNFEWYGMVGKTIGLNGYVSEINDTEYNYAPLSGRLVSSIGSYADIYRIGYGIYYNFENAFKMMNAKWDVFVGLGAGIAIVNGGTYVGSEIERKTASSISIDEDGNQVQTNVTTYEYTENDVIFSTNASKYRLTKSKALAVAYQGKIGVLANISQSFAASVSLAFGATSRPLFTTKFKYIDKQKGMRSHLEYHIALEIGILLKAFSIAI